MANVPTSDFHGQNLIVPISDFHGQCPYIRYSWLMSLHQIFMAHVPPSDFHGQCCYIRCSWPISLYQIFKASVKNVANPPFVSGLFNELFIFDSKTVYTDQDNDNVPYGLCNIVHSTFCLRHRIKIFHFFPSRYCPCCRSTCDQFPHHSTNPRHLLLP